MQELYSKLISYSLLNNLGYSLIQGSPIIDDLSAFGSSNDLEEDILGYAVKYTQKVKRYYRQSVKDYHNGVFAGNETNKPVLF
jgi:hypothetical protein